MVIPVYDKYYTTILLCTRDDDDDDSNKMEKIGKPTQKPPNPNQTAKTFPFVRAAPLSACTTSIRLTTYTYYAYYNNNDRTL